MDWHIDEIGHDAEWGRTQAADLTKKLGYSNYFANRDGRADIPMVDVFRFAIVTSRRVEEITRIKWVNLDEAKGVAMLEDVKHPTRKKGNDRTFRLLSEG